MQNTKLYIYAMLDKFKIHIQNNLSFLLESKCLLAISGGLDSVVLAHLCKAINLNIALAHCNFNLRGAQSDGDEEFLNELADQLELELFTQHFDTKTYALENKLSIQMAARELRYEWFNELALQLDFDSVLTAHHADDELETFLINLSRGTGLDGLKGIPEVNGIVVRPLLPFSRNDMTLYATDNELKWREDTSNEDTKYLRNKIRKDIVPALKTLDTDFLIRFKRTQDHLKDASEIVTDRLDAIADNIIQVTTQGMFLNIALIKNLSSPKAYLYHLLKDFGFTEWDDVVDLLDGQSGKQVFSNEYRLLKDREHLILSRTFDSDPLEIFIPNGVKKLDIPLGIMTFNESDKRENNTGTTIYVDADRLDYPLMLRKWRKGDVFHPIGMNGKKKISKYFKDEKFSLLEKESTWLLCSGGEVVWVVGKRADDRFKVQDTTQKIVKISLSI